MLEGKISLELVDDKIALISEINNRKIFELPLDDDYYNKDIYSFAKNLMTQCMGIIEQVEGKDGMIEAIEETLCENWGSYEIL